MSIASEIERLNGAKSAISAAIAEKGVTVPDGTKIDGVAAYIEAITPKLQEKTVAPSTSAQTVTPDSGYDGLSKVIVYGMTSEIKVATGTFKQSAAWNLYQKPVTITGLGFKPKYVFVRYGTPSTTGSSLVSSTTLYFLTAMDSEHPTEATAIKRGSSFTELANIVGKYNLSLTDEGFVLSSNNASYTVDTSTYQYIAIG